jgi:uncharacterized heparinase superfamily protein
MPTPTISAACAAGIEREGAPMAEGTSATRMDASSNSKAEGNPRLAWLSAAAQRPLSLNLRSVVAAARGLIFAMPGYDVTLVGRPPAGLRTIPPDPWPGDAEHGRAIMNGEFTFAGRSAIIVTQNPASVGAGSGDLSFVWSPSGTDPAWRAALHGFGWLKDLRIVGGEPPRQWARAMIESWIAHHGRWNALSWRADILATRLCSWMTMADFLLTGADQDFATRFHDSLARQARHLFRAAPGDLMGSRLLTAIKGMVYVGACLPMGSKRLARATNLLDHELTAQVLGDGGHVERSPRQQLAVLRDLIDMRATLAAAQLEIPDTLQTAIDRMAPMLRFFRHGDGALALFNDSVENEAWLIDLVLTQSDAKGKPLSSAPHSAFERIAANRTLLLVDVGAPPQSGYESHCFAGTLSFEMSVGKERLIVNGGASIGGSPVWRRAMQSTPAHSTLTIADRNSSEIFDDEGLFKSSARPLGRIVGRRPDRVSCRRDEADGAVWLEGSHDGYLKPFGLIHRRRIYLSPAGDDLRGEDLLVLPEGMSQVKPEILGKSFTLRFHLHPTVRASLVQDGAAVLLRLSGGGWRFRSAGAQHPPLLEESVYLGQRGEPRRSEQITVTGEIGPEGAMVKWALRRVGDR